MTGVIEMAAVEDNRMFADGLRAWVATVPDIRLAAVTTTVDDLLGITLSDHAVILLNPTLRADPDPAGNVRRLTGAGHAVLVIDASADPAMVARALAAGAHGYLTRDHDLVTLGNTVRAVASGATAWSIAPAAAGPSGSPRPALSEREHRVLMAYVSGLTLDSAARQIGISPETAKTYLKRVKAKYQEAGLPVYTKLDLAEQVRADSTPGYRRTSG
jgi:DNA-binding NarL/FixJ family response regulator